MKLHEQMYISSLHREYRGEDNTQDEDFDYRSVYTHLNHLQVQNEQDPGKAGLNEALLICAERRILMVNQCKELIPMKKDN